MNFLLLIFGLILLVKGADFFVSGSSSIAKRFNVPSMVIGLTLVAFGTSSPELAVSVSASLSHSNGIVFGNVVGSNIINLLFILGLSAVIAPIKIESKTITKEMPFTILTTIAMMAMVMDTFINDKPFSVISHSEGFILILFFLIYLYSMVEIAIMGKDELGEDTILLMPLSKSIIYTIGGLAAIIIGSNLAVEGAVSIAQLFGLSETLIGLTIVALGTSLPELLTSIVAARKGENAIAVGNVIGSNIFNILFVLGTSAIVYPIQIDVENYLDLWILLISLLIVVPIMYTSKKISRTEGVIMLIGYLAYTLFLIFRASGMF